MVRQRGDLLTQIHITPLTMTLYCNFHVVIERELATSQDKDWPRTSTMQQPMDNGSCQITSYFVEQSGTCNTASI